MELKELDRIRFEKNISKVVARNSLNNVEELVKNKILLESQETSE